MAYTELYVRSDAAGGGDGSTDAASGGTGALTYAEMLAYADLRDIRFNVKSGTYSRSATDTFTAATSAATAAQPCAIRGFNATAGDLDTVVRTAGQALTTTNHPSFSYSSGTLTLPAYCEVSNIIVTNSSNATTLSANTGNTLRNCVVSNSLSGAGASVRGFVDGSSDRSQSINCDFSVATSSAVATVSLDTGSIMNCLVNGGGNGGNGITAASINGIINCMIRDCTDAITITANTATIYGCSFRNITGVAIKSSSGVVSSISNCVAWLAGGTSVWYSGQTSVRGHLQYNNAVGNAGAADANEGNWAVIDEVALTSDPFTSSTDLTLNNTAGGGADCRAAGIWPYADLGAWQHQDAGGALLTHPGMAGGCNG